MQQEGPKSTGVINIRDEADERNKRSIGTDMNHVFKYRWHIINQLLVLHIGAFYGIYACFNGAKLATMLWGGLILIAANQAVVLGAHRGYSHKSFTPTTALKIALVIFETMAGQGSIFWWARNHRLHHKFTDTDADPHNSSRGFFFSHMKWLMLNRHPLVIEKGKTIDVSDLKADKILMFQHRYYTYINFTLATISVMIPIYGWNESFWNAFCIVYLTTMTFNIHAMSSINSFAHMFGEKPFDSRINPVQSRLVHWLTGGDGWHNFHHCFPWDYGMSEFGYGKGLSTRLIELFAYLGLAYDLKKASPNVVMKHSIRHGDGSLKTS